MQSCKGTGVHRAESNPNISADAAEQILTSVPDFAARSTYALLKHPKPGANHLQPLRGKDTVTISRIKLTASSDLLRFVTTQTLLQHVLRCTAGLQQGYGATISNVAHWWTPACTGQRPVKIKSAHQHPYSLVNTHDDHRLSTMQE
jgi:hypothetical protein